MEELSIHHIQLLPPQAVGNSSMTELEGKGRGEFYELGIKKLVDQAIIIEVRLFLIFKVTEKK